MELQRYMRIRARVNQRLRGLSPEDREDCTQFVAMRDFEKDGRGNVNHLISDWCRLNGWSSKRPRFGAMILGLARGGEYLDSAHGRATTPKDGLINLELSRILDRVSGRQREVLEMQAMDLNFREIGNRLNLCESRVCQISKKGIQKARRAIEMLEMQNREVDSTEAPAVIAAQSLTMSERVHRRPKGLLSAREQEVVEELRLGLKNKEIADKLFVCEKTVKFHLTQIYKKLNVKSRAQLIVKMMPKYEAPAVIAQDAHEVETTLPVGGQKAPEPKPKRLVIAQEVRGLVGSFQDQDKRNTCLAFAMFLETAA